MPRLSFALLALPGCTVETVRDAPSYATAPRVISPAPGSYCAEAVAEAEDSAAIAQATGDEQDAGRAGRTAHFAARDCRP